MFWHDSSTKTLIYHSGSGRGTGGFGDLTRNRMEEEGWEIKLGVGWKRKKGEIKLGVELKKK